MKKEWNGYNMRAELIVIHANHEDIITIFISTIIYYSFVKPLFKFASGSHIHVKCIMLTPTGEKYKLKLYIFIVKMDKIHLFNLLCNFKQYVLL
jgi:hypothetical protein